MDSISRFGDGMSRHLSLRSLIPTLSVAKPK
jgi:hypothetical protein